MPLRFSLNTGGDVFILNKRGGIIRRLVPLLSLGDCNQDGVVDFSDIAPFIAILSTGDYLAEADTNEDGIVNFSDISSSIRLLSS